MAKITLDFNGPSAEKLAALSKATSTSPKGVVANALRLYEDVLEGLEPSLSPGTEVPSAAVDPAPDSLSFLAIVNSDDAPQSILVVHGVQTYQTVAMARKAVDLSRERREDEGPPIKGRAASIP
jgi:hypothetical protein